jgi:hypothetical protein
MIHHPTHWIAVALVAALGLLALEAGGQGSGAAATFEGRPAMSGAQAGLGALAGPPQGGIGVQGTQAAQLNLRKPPIIEEPRDMPQGELAQAPEQPRPVIASIDDERLLPQRLEPDVTPAQARRMAREAS